MSASLDKLLANPRVWRGRDQAGCRAGLASGYSELDRHLPGGGWPPDALTEILTGHYGIGELRLLMPALARLSTTAPQHDFAEPGWIAWIAPPFQPYPPALQQCGLDLSRMLIVRPEGADEVLWSAEQALTSGTCAAVLLWPEALDDQAGRRLQLAAEKGRSWAIAFRPPSARRQPSAAALRLELQTNAEGTRVHILKSRGGRPAVIDKLL
ncbi:MAG: translesion DNA synthesis-associated protein ImuA [Gammaproteobacteria bacterium]|nr:translesion DNA synthesis-associated protein ImuA [Gammaproteobacteria bacterium]NNF48322.1 translesion DNA synthesis-associated protein ImuA [Woeseiaceae bacterium]MBT8094979.1 translesion DNA synthesis-associated protein ImuA [Gammaproteobacteria bacterium]MBT8104649.1 translesion DNA synthesis-associated protein ImuA [Gammaproteobacteria bacterium]NNK24663.1 translesion DNA synthesis-associated protein ImuA [Woeseiaceae bacterium]